MIRERAKHFLAVLISLFLLAFPACGCGASLSREASSIEREAGEGGGAVLYIGVMVHLEGWNGEASSRDSFAAHSAGIREYAAIFEKYGAKLTLEASPEFALACRKWGDNVLAEMQERGHGIGLHADLGGNPGMDQQEFETRLRGMKDLFLPLGVTIRHVSGISSHLDFVEAAKNCGFLFITGLVEYALRAIPSESLPSQYREAAERHGSIDRSHGTVPYDIEKRLHPWRMNSGSDWLWNDPSGEVVYLPGDSGTEIKVMSEIAGGTASLQQAPFTNDDIEAFLAEMEECLRMAEEGQVNVFYVAWSIGRLVDAGLVEEWLQAIQPYVDKGLVEWKSLPEMYDTYLQWETAAS